MIVLRILLNHVRLPMVVGLMLLLNACAITPVFNPLPEGTPSSQRNEYVITEINKLLSTKQDSSAPGVSVVVVRNGKVVYSQNKGLAVIGKHAGESDIAISPDTIFNIASIAKPITAVAIMQLMEKGQLTLNDSMRKWLPYLPSAFEGITIHHLLSHQSGLMDRITIFRLDEASVLDGITNQQLIQHSAEDAILSFAPGTSARYLNINYALLAEIVSRVSGQPYEKYLHKNIFAPLGMHSTYVYGSPVPNGAVVARNHGRDMKTYGITFALTGPMGIYSTSTDLASFINGVFSGKLLSLPTLRLMTSDQSKSKVDWQDNHYGYGWHVPEQTAGLSEFYHPGSADGYQSLVYIGYKQSFGVIVLSNGGDKTGKIINAIGKIVREAYLL